MFAFRVRWIEVVCAVCAAAMGAISPLLRVPAGRIPSCLRSATCLYTWLCHTIFASRNGVFVRHIACSVTVSFRANATFAFLGPVRSAIALAQVRR